MKRTWIEVSCDECGRACYYVPGSVNKRARADGWIITRDGKHFCSKTCQTKRDKEAKTK